MSTISEKSALAAADLAALDLDMVIDVSAGSSGTKKMYAIAKALGLGKLLTFSDTGGDDAYVISTGLSLSSLSAGFEFRAKLTTGNTGACTLAVDSVAATAIKVVDASGVRDPLTGELAAGMTAQLHYNGTYFILLNPARNYAPLTLFFYKANPSDGDNLLLNGIAGVTSYVTRQKYSNARINGAFSSGAVFSSVTSLTGADTGFTLSLQANVGTGGGGDQNTITLFTDASGIITSSATTDGGAQTYAWATVELF